MKGILLSKLGSSDEAHTAFLTAVTLSDGLGRSWLEWAQFCDSQFTGNGLKNSNFVFPPFFKTDFFFVSCHTNNLDKLQWGEYAITCYLMAVKTGSNRSRRFLSRVLWLLNFNEDPNTNSLINNFNKYADTLPYWVWVSWLPHLLRSLSFAEGKKFNSVSHYC